MSDTTVLAAAFILGMGVTWGLLGAATIGAVALYHVARMFMAFLLSWYSLDGDDDDGEDADPPEALRGTGTHGWTGVRVGDA